MKTLLILVVIVVILSAGCVEQQATPTNYKLVDTNTLEKCNALGPVTKEVYDKCVKDNVAP